MTKIILTPHGHVEGINPERFRGRTDLSLTELGEAQARAVAARVASEWTPSVVYTSPMRRCLATAEAIATMCRVSVEILNDLTDLDYGEWQWQTYAEVCAASPQADAEEHPVRISVSDARLAHPVDSGASGADQIRPLFAPVNAGQLFAASDRVG